MSAAPAFDPERQRAAWPGKGPTRAARAASAADAVQALAAGIWIGGLFALGAVTAPRIFNELPRSDAAPLMTSIFRGYDTFVLTFAAMIAVAEIVRVWARGVGAWLGRARVILATLLCATGALSSLVISRKIEALMASGAQRGVGEAGRSLAAWHKAAELIARGTVLFGAALIVVVVLSRPRPLEKT